MPSNRPLEYGTTGNADTDEINRQKALAMQEGAQNGAVQTTKATSVYEPVTEPQETMADAFGTGLGYKSPFREGSDNYYKDIENNLRKQSQATVDPQSIRRQVISSVQDRIDALNAVYDTQLAKVKQEGQGRVGSGTAILARRGLAGSPRGSAIQEGVLEQNRGIESDVNNERNLAVQVILGKADDIARQEVADRRAAKEKSASDYLNYIKTKGERTQKNIDTNIAALIAQGIDPKELDPTELEDLAKKLGTDVNSFIGSYRMAKIASDEAEAAAATEAAQAGAFNLSEGQARYDANGNIIASRSKTYAPSSGGGGGTGTSYGNVSPAAKNILDLMNKSGLGVEAYVTGSSNAAQALKNEVYAALASQGGVTDKSLDIIRDGKAVIDKMVENNDYKKFGYSARLGGQLTTGFGDMQQRAQQVSAILARDNLGLLKGAMSDKDLAFIEAMSGGIGSGTISEEYAKERIEDIQTKLKERLDDSRPVQYQIQGSEDIGSDPEVEELRAQGYTDEQINAIING